MLFSGYFCASAQGGNVSSADAASSAARTDFFMIEILLALILTFAVHFDMAPRADIIGPRMQNKNVRRLQWILH
jgi:hypothetical protein